MKRILVPVDRTVGLNQLIETVRKEALAVPEGAVVRLFYAPTRFSPDMLTIMLKCDAGVDGYWSNAEFCAYARLDPLAHSLKRKNVAGEVEISDSLCPFPIRTIFNEAKRWKADRMIIGIHSVTGFKRWLLQTLFDKFILRRPSPPHTDSGNSNERPQEVIGWAEAKATLRAGGHQA